MFTFTGIRGFSTEEDLNLFFQSHPQNRDFAVIFGNDTNEFKYTIRTRNNNFHTDKLFVNNIYDLANRGLYKSEIL